MNDDHIENDNTEKSNCFHFVNKTKTRNSSEKSENEELPPSVTTDCLVRYNSENSGLTNVTLCCAVTEDSQTKGKFQYVGKSKVRVDSYQKLDNLEITMETHDRVNERRLSDEQVKNDIKSVHTFIRNAVVISGSVSCRNGEEEDEEQYEKMNVLEGFKKIKRVKRAKSTGSLYVRPITDHRSDSDSFDSSLESLIKHNLRTSQTQALQPVSVSKAKER